MAKQSLFKHFSKIIFDKLTFREKPASVTEATNIILAINALKLKGLENIKCGNVLCVPIRCSALRSIFFNIAVLFRALFRLDDIEEKKIGDQPKLAILFSNSYRGRKDHIMKTDKISALIDNKIIFYPKDKRKFSYKYALQYIQNLHLLFSWIVTLHKVVSLKRAVNYAVHLYIANFDADLIMTSMIVNNIYSIISLCDTHIIDALVVQKAKQQGISTATMQHGFYAFEAPAMEYSNSNYFLAFGQADVDNAGRFYDPKKYLKVGMPQLIGISISQSMIRHKVKAFLLILGGDTEEETSALKVTETLVPYYKRIIKLHPGFNSDDYRYRWLPSDVIITDESSVYQLTEKAGFAVIPSGSTTFIEYMVILFPSFIFENKIPRF